MWVNCTQYYQLSFSVCLSKIMKIGWRRPMSKLWVKAKWALFIETPCTSNISCPNYWYYCKQRRSKSPSRGCCTVNHFQSMSATSPFTSFHSWNMFMTTGIPRDYHQCRVNRCGCGSWCEASWWTLMKTSFFVKVKTNFSCSIKRFIT